MRFGRDLVMNQFGNIKDAVERNFLQQLYKDFWILLPLGGTFGYYHTKTWKWICGVNYFLMYFFVLMIMGMLVYTIFLVSDNLVLFSLSTHIFIVGCVAIGASLPASLRRKEIISAAAFYVDPFFADYSRCEFFECLQRETKRRKNIRIITLMGLYGLCSVIAVLQPLIDYVFNCTLGYTSVNGVWLNLPGILWFPFDLDSSVVAYLGAYACEVVFVWYVALMVTSGNALCFMVMDQILDQVKILIYSIRCAEERALKMFAEKYPGHHPHARSAEFEECCCQCIVQNVEHHHKIRGYLKVLSDLVSVPIAVPFFGGALLLGLAAITLTAQDDPRMGPKFLATSLAISEAYNMYQLCYFGQQFEDLSGDLYNALYFMKWYNRLKKFRRLLMIMRYGCYKPIALTIGKLLVLNFKLFGDLVNSAYSIFNLKSASAD